MRLMKCLVLVAALVIAVTASADQGDQVDPKAGEKAGMETAEAEKAKAEVIELNRRIVEANMKGEPELMVSVTADEFRVIAPGGRVEETPCLPVAIERGFC